MTSKLPENHAMMHDQIWHAVDRMAQSFGYSPSGLAKQAGLDPTSFNKSKRINADGKPRWPSTESIARILAATGATMSDFMALMDSGDPHAPENAPRYIPLIGFAQAGHDGFFNTDGYPKGDAWDEISFPNNHSYEEGIYALEVSGDSMLPLYRNGDILIVCPSASIRKGDRIVVKTTDGEVMAKELQRQNANKLDLKSHNPDFALRTLSIDEISWTARILWVSQ